MTQMLEVHVSGIVIDRERGHPVVLLKTERDDEVMPIWIGPAEAVAIYTILSEKTYDRPMTHDLLKLVVEELGAYVSSIEISGLHEDTYFARIILRREEEIFYIDARPSDSLALALRSGASILVDREMFHKHKRDLKISKDEEEDIKRHLQELDHKDFGDFDL